MAVQDTVTHNGMSRVVIRTNGKLMPSRPRLYYTGGEVIHEARSVNCIPAVDGSKSHQRGREQSKSAMVTASASQRADSALTRKHKTAPIKGRKTIRLSQGKELVMVVKSHWTVVPGWDTHPRRQGRGSTISFHG